MVSSRSFLALHDEEERKCLLCGYLIKGGKVTKFKSAGWAALKEKAQRWSIINITFDDQKYCSTKVHEKIKEL